MRSNSEWIQPSKRKHAHAHAHRFQGGGSRKERTSGPPSSAPQALEGDAAAGPRVQRRRDVAEVAALRGSPTASTEAMRRLATPRSRRRRGGSSGRDECSGAARVGELGESGISKIETGTERGSGAGEWECEGRRG